MPRSASDPRGSIPIVVHALVSGPKGGDEEAWSPGYGSGGGAGSQCTGSDGEQPGKGDPRRRRLRRRGVDTRVGGWAVRRPGGYGNEKLKQIGIPEPGVKGSLLCIQIWPSVQQRLPQGMHGGSGGFSLGPGAGGAGGGGATGGVGGGSWTGGLGAFSGGDGAKGGGWAGGQQPVAHRERPGLHLHRPPLQRAPSQHSRLVSHFRPGRWQAAAASPSPRRMSSAPRAPPVIAFSAPRRDSDAPRRRAMRSKVSPSMSLLLSTHKVGRGA